jgi:hypothetical protein
LRDPSRKNKDGKIVKAVYLPVITYHLNQFVKKSHTIAVNAAKSKGMFVPLDLYRGMSNSCIQTGFLQEGGVEMAPMSTTKDLAIALKYSAVGKQSVLLRIRNKNVMDMAPTIRWISAFVGGAFVTADYIFEAHVRYA